MASGCDLWVGGGLTNDAAALRVGVGQNPSTLEATRARHALRDALTQLKTGTQAIFSLTVLNLASGPALYLPRPNPRLLRARLARLILQG
jgi:hypothetical protein